MRFFILLILCASLIPFLLLLNIYAPTNSTTTTTSTQTTTVTTTTTVPTTSTTQTTTTVPTTQTTTTTTVPTTTSTQTTTTVPTTVPSGLINLTAGLGLDGGTITDSGTISLSNIPNVLGNWTSLNSLTIDNQGRINQVTNYTSSFAGNFSYPSYVNIDEFGRVTDVAEGLKPKENGFYQRGVNSVPITSTIPQHFAGITGQYFANSLYLVVGTGQVTTGTLIIGLYQNNILIFEKNYTSTIRFTFVFHYFNLLASNPLISQNITLKRSVTPGGSAVTGFNGGQGDTHYSGF